MSDGTVTVDGREIHIADLAADAGMIVTGATVSESRKENLGNYENVEPHASVRVEFHPAIEVESPTDKAELKHRLAELRRVVDDHIQESIDRTKADREMDG
jgi:hypothetical protein